MDKRFFGTAEGSRDPVFPVKMKQAGNVVHNKIHHKEQGQHTGAQDKQLPYTQVAKHVFIERVAEGGIHDGENNNLIELF